MKEWLTAQEIADEVLPHVPCTKRGVNDMAEREGWNADEFRCRKRAGRGGGREYHIGLLPVVARVAYHAQHVVIGRPSMPAAANDTPAIVPAKAATGRATLERDARLAIVSHFQRFHDASGLRQTAAMQIFSDDYNLRRLHIETWITDVVRRLSKGSLKRWMAKKRTGKAIGVDRSFARKGTGTLDAAEGGEVRAFILGLIAFQPHLSADQVRDQVRGRFGERLKVVSKGVEASVPVPPVRAFQRLLAVLKATEKVVLTKLTNPDLFRSTMKLSGTGTLRHVTEPNSHWQIDASPVDALCNDGRHSVYVCVDIATRRMILLLSRTPTAAAVGLLLRKAILEWGVPLEIKTDNGSDFVARSTKRLLASLGIDLKTSDAFSPEQKGFVERQIGTFQRDAVALVPGFIGHSVTDRKAIESRKSFAQRLGEDDANTFMVACSAAEMQQLFDDWSNLRHQHRAHGGLKGRTPFQVAATAEHTIRRVDERALDLLLAPIAKGGGTRVATKLGFQVDNLHYLNGALLPGTRAFIRHDPLDMGRIHLFDTEDGGYLGDALCAEIAGIEPEAFVRASKELQAETIRLKTIEIEKVRRELRKGPALIERAREVWLRDVPNVVALPKPETQHVTREIAAALEASTGENRRNQPAPLTGRAAEVHARLKVEMAAPMAEVSAPAATVTRIKETPRMRFRRALDLEARMQAGEAIEAADAHWLGGYQLGPEYAGERRVYDRFNGAVRL